MAIIKGPLGIEWHYEEAGKGEPLLFLHGWGVDYRVWRQQIKHFAARYRVFAVDLPGHGETTWVEASFEEMCSDLSKALVQIVPGKLTTVSSSLGGLFALKIYSGMPEKFERMVFTGSMPKFSKSADYPYGLDIDRMRKLSGQLESDYPAIVDVFFRSLFTKEERRTRRYKWLQKFRKFDEKPMKSALAKYLDVLEAVDLREELKAAQIPLQFINGDGDEICTSQCVALIKTLKPDARYDHFPHCGHFPFLSKPYEFNELLEDFLQTTGTPCC